MKRPSPLSQYPTFEPFEPRLLLSAAPSPVVEYGAASASGSVAEQYGIVETGPMFEGLVLVDEINCGDPGDSHTFQESTGASHIETLLGTPTRVMSPTSETEYFAYRIGQGMGLVPGKAYLLTVDYPEDQPRSVFVVNGGSETTRGFHTGPTVGDALHPPYVGSNPESLSFPLSGEGRTWQQLFHLHDNFSGIQEARGGDYRPLSPADGFWVTIAQFKQSDAPLSHGAAVSRIRLYEAPEMATYAQPLNLPENLPHRSLFFREEMADGVIGSNGITNETDWFEYKARLMKFLGMNVYSKDLLEFGSNQGWDSSPHGGNNWYYQSSNPQRWEQILTMLDGYDFGVMPYFEYNGSKGTYGLGFEKHAKPLGGGDDYTHVSWCETANADVTYSLTLTDAQWLLECTMEMFKNDADFVGAWFRNRPSHNPISFSDDALALFATEANGGVSVTRPQLETNQALLDSYYEWWFDERKDFLNSLRDYLRVNGVGDDAVILYTPDSTESGVSYPDWNGPSVITDDPATWSALGEDPMSFDQAVAQEHHLDAMLEPRLTWGEWEWEHSVPAPDVDNYADNDGVMMTYTFNKGYTVASPTGFEAFETPSGTAMIRHYCLNEDTMGGKLGYFVSDVEMAGPYSMIGEAWAMAYGNPTYIGYLASSTFNHGFPEYARAFNAAYLSLPALPSVAEAGASDDDEVLVRSIDAGDEGTYVSVVNVGLNDKHDVQVELPVAGEAYDAVTGEALSTPGGVLTLSMYPCQLRAIRVVGSIPGDANGDGAVTDADYTVWADNYGASSADPSMGDFNGDGDVTDADYTVWADNYGYGTYEAPEAHNDYAQTDAGVPVQIHVLDNDTGQDLEIFAAADGQHGTVDHDGSIATYTPEDGWDGTDTFLYVITDGQATSYADVTVIVSPVQDLSTTLYSWENDVEGWRDSGGNGALLPATFSSTEGVTEGSYSLELDVPQSAPGEASWSPFGGAYVTDPTFIEEVATHEIIKLDVTVPASTVYVPSWAGVQVALMLQSNVANTSDVAYTMCAPGQTTTIQFDYSSYDFTGSSWVQLRFITNIPNLLSDPGLIYLDNFRVENPSAASAQATEAVSAAIWAPESEVAELPTEIVQPQIPDAWIGVSGPVDFRSAPQIQLTVVADSSPRMSASALATSDDGLIDLLRSPEEVLAV
jgi:Big-like domain-containing protein